MSEDRFRTGLENRTRVMGSEFVENQFANADSFSIDFQRLVTEYCWGEVWSQPALTDKHRSLINLGLLAALNRPREFQSHFRGALNNGCSLDELRETLMQIAIYVGIPAGVEAFRLAKEVLEAQHIEVAPADRDSLPAP